MTFGKFEKKCYFLGNYYNDFLQKFKNDFGAGVTILADRGYRFIQDDIRQKGYDILIPAIQQTVTRLGDDDSQPQNQSQPTSQPIRSQNASQDDTPLASPSTSQNAPQSSQQNTPPSSQASSQQQQSSEGYHSGPRGSASRGTRSRGATSKEKYFQSKPLGCADANASRMISSRRHPIENINGAIKRFKMFNNVVPAERLDSGFCLAGINLVASVMNYRFLNDSMVMGLVLIMSRIEFS